MLKLLKTRLHSKWTSLEVPGHTNLDLGLELVNSNREKKEENGHGQRQAVHSK